VLKQKGNKNMKQLNETIFDETGLDDLEPAEKERILTHVAKTLETRVGMRLTADANEEQIAQFSQLVEGRDEEAIFDWLDRSFPNFQAVVDEELEDIKTELTNMAQKILRARH
jgi:hypothetical protein